MERANLSQQLEIGNRLDIIIKKKHSLKLEFELVSCLLLKYLKFLQLELDYEKKNRFAFPKIRLGLYVSESNRFTPF